MWVILKNYKATKKWIVLEINLNNAYALKKMRAMHDHANLEIQQ